MKKGESEEIVWMLAQWKGIKNTKHFKQTWENDNLQIVSNPCHLNCSLGLSHNNSKPDSHAVVSLFAVRDFARARAAYPFSVVVGQQNQKTHSQDSDMAGMLVQCPVRVADLRSVEADEGSSESHKMRRTTASFWRTGCP